MDAGWVWMDGCRLGVDGWMQAGCVDEASWVNGCRLDEWMQAR